MGGSSLWPSPDTRLIGEPQRRSMIPCQGILRVPATLVYYSQESEYYQSLPSGTKLRWLVSTTRVRSSCKCENITVHWLTQGVIVSFLHEKIEWVRKASGAWLGLCAGCGALLMWWVTPWFSEACYCIITIRSYNFAETPPTFLIHLSLCLQI